MEANIQAGNEPSQFDVTICRTVCQHLTLRVPARSHQEAIKRALEEAPSHDFAAEGRAGDTDYAFTGVIEDSTGAGNR